ncbi:MAG: hypothetical protein ABIC68_01265 [Candidatus Omnitrophota bacterium]
MFRKIFKKHEKKGQALILSYMVISSFIIFSAGLLTKAISEKNLEERARLTQQAFYMAEGATEDAIQAFTTDMANFVIPINTAVYNHVTTFTTLAGATANTTITQMEPSDRVINDGSINIFVRNYEVASTAIHPHNANISVTVHQIIARRLIPTFQHAVFYNDDLEIFPGANMVLSGRIHSNKDIFLGSNATLRIDSFYLHCAGDIFEDRKDEPGTVPPGNVSIRVTKSGAAQYQNMAGLDSTDTNWATESTDRWKGTVQTAVHGVTSLTTPSVGSITPTGYYANNANVIIANDTIIKNGVTLTEGVDYPAGTITNSTSFYNNREGKNIKMSVVDLDKLSGNTGTCSGGACPNNLPSNGLIYATRNDHVGSDQPGIKLINGSEIRSATGLTVVSNDPVYIQGDYNTVNEKPASVICDAINLLSNNWADTNSTLGVSSRNANNTIFNTAIIAGVDSSTVGGYNGGLENYPRMHENWSGRNLTVKGSFVSLWGSAIATGGWQYGNPQYTAPNRNWLYNSNFNNAANLPPFTPMAVEARRIAWWKD